MIPKSEIMKDIKLIKIENFYTSKISVSNTKGRRKAEEIFVTWMTKD